MSYKILPLQKKRKFYNSFDQHPESLLFGTLPSFLKALWHRRTITSPADIGEWLDTRSSVVARSNELHITWLGHSTFLIQVDGVNIITDPIFGELSMMFPRILPVGISRELLPVIDLVLISHNHRDHMDESSLNYLKSRNPALTVLVGHGDKRWFDRRGFQSVSQHVWWDDRKIYFNRQDGADVSITCTFLPAWHWSQRALLDKNRSLWGSWMIQAGSNTIYFAGDTAYSPHFSAVARHFPEIHVALMPIGPCEPHDWMKHTHLNACQAVQAFLDLQAHHFIPMHWGTFGFGHDHFDLPIERLKEAWHARRNLVGDKQLGIVKAGQRIQPSISHENFYAADLQHK